jgi:hypothetical protein
MAVIVYPVAKVTDVIEALDPIAGYVGIGPCLLGSPVESTDGRYCYCHPWNEAEQDFLAGRIDGITGAVVLDELPLDWVSLP